MLLIYYIGSGALCGALLYGARSQDGSEEEETRLVTYWYRGFFLQLINVTFTPKQMVIGHHDAGLFCGKHGRCSSGSCMKSSRRARHRSNLAGMMLRKLPDVMGGYTMLTFRYANLQGVPLLCAQARCMVAQRVAMPGGDNVVFQEPCDIRGFEQVGAVIAPSFFLHHVIDEKSPLFDATRPGRCNFERCMRIFLSVSGWDATSTQHAGGSNWGTADIVMDARFNMMQKVGGRNARSVIGKPLKAVRGLKQKRQGWEHRASKLGCQHDYRSWL